MSNPSLSPLPADLDTWVEEARADPRRYRDRKVTHILLHAIGRTPALRKTLYLKGGTLLSAVHGSVRQTGDVDFSSNADPEAFIQGIRPALDAALIASAAQLGYVGLHLAVQTIRKEPSVRMFAAAQAPAIKLTIGVAVRGTGAVARLEKGQAPDVLNLDISFREPVIALEVVQIGSTGSTVLAYTVPELIAEKLRALVQQPIRKRNRRQDVYDIAWLLSERTFNDAEKADILHAFKAKAEERDISPSPDALDDPKVREYAAAEWDTMALEIGTVPKFETCFSVVAAFYRSLPWS